MTPTRCAMRTTRHRENGRNACTHAAWYESTDVRASPHLVTPLTIGLSGCFLGSYSTLSNSVHPLTLPDTVGSNSVLSRTHVRRAVLEFVHSFTHARCAASTSMHRRRRHVRSGSESMHRRRTARTMGSNSVHRPWGPETRRWESSPPIRPAWRTDVNAPARFVSAWCPTVTGAASAHRGGHRRVGSSASMHEVRIPCVSET